jgi:hypothetical protein
VTTHILLRSAPQLSGVVLGEVELPQSGLNPGSNPPSPPHFSAALLAMAVLAVAVVAFLGWDVFRQKRAEKRERRRLERFREKKLNNVSDRPAVSPQRDKSPSRPG